MGIDFIEQELRKYEVSCEYCKEKFVARSRSKNRLKATLRKSDWSIREVGFLGLVECTCPECGKKRKNRGD